MGTLVPGTGTIRPHRADRRIPAPPPRWIRHRPWNAADLVAVAFSARRDLDRETVSFGLVPVHLGRVVLRGAQYGKVTLDGTSPEEAGVTSATGGHARVPDVEFPEELLDTLGGALDGQCLIAWSAGAEAAILDEMFGGGRKGWVRRTLDVRRMARTSDRLLGRVAGQGYGYGLAAAADVYRVPMPRPCDALDEALTTGELFLVLATKLARMGYADIGSLLRTVDAAPAPEVD